MKTINTELPLEDVLYAFSTDEREVSSELLDEYTRCYPAYAQALTELALELAQETFQVVENALSDKEPQDLTNSPAVARAVSGFRYHLNAVRTKAAVKGQATATPSKPVVNPFSSLNRQETRSLVASLNVSTLFVMKLRDRMIDASTMTKGFVKFVADGLGISPEILIAHLLGPPLAHAQQDFKSDQKPEASAKQSFSVAVLSSGLTEDQQRNLTGL